MVNFLNVLLTEMKKSLIEMTLESKAQNVLKFHLLFLNNVILCHFQAVRLLYQYMTNVTECTGVKLSEAKHSMKDVLKFEAALALVIH